MLTGALLVLPILIAGVMSPHTANASTGINQEMSFEGKIVTSSGTNIPDGTYNMEFRIYTGCTNEPTSNAGCTPVWTEDWLDNNTQGVAFTSGTYQVDLGAICGFTTGTCENNSNTVVNWNSYPLYLSLQIGNTSNCSTNDPGTSAFTADCGGDGVMNPYVLLTSTPYSLNSGELGGITASGFVQTAPSATQTIQPTANATGLVVEQNSGGAYSSDIFDVQGTGGSSDNFVQVTSSAANTGNVSIAGLGSSSTVSIQAGGSGTITIGNQSASTANTIDIGSTTTNANADAVNIDTESANTGTVTIGGTGAATGTITVGQSTGTNTIDVGYGATASASTQTINIGTQGVSGSSTTIQVGTGAGLESVTAGSASGASTTVLQAGSGGMTLSTGAASGTTGAISILSGNSSGGSSGNVSIDTGSAVLSGTAVVTDTFDGTGSGSMNDWGTSGGDDWYSATETFSNTQSYSGGYSLKISETAASWGAEENYNAVAVTAGTQYLITAWMRAGTNGETIYPDMAWVGGGTETTLATVTDNSTGWTEISGEVVAPVGATGAYFQINSSNGASGQLQYLDSYQVVNLSSITAPAVNVGTTNAQAVTVGNVNQAGYTTIQGGGDGVRVLGATSAVITIGTSNGNVVEIGNTSAATTLTGSTYTNSSSGVCITATAGSCSTNSSIVLLDLDQSTTQAAETSGDCSTSINEGGLYYSAATAASNTTTQELRGCIDGSWRDVITADQLGVILLGVVPDSGSNPGDLGGITGTANGPCKVAWASSTSVSVAPCTAYSAGRKVVVTAATTVTGINGVSKYYHICLSGTNNAPATTTGNASETGVLPTFSATAPVLCLATVLTGSGSTITNIWDTRIFTTDTKTFTTTVAAMAPGWIAVQTAANEVTTTTTANAAGVAGVIAVGSTAGSTSAINGIMVTNGPAYVSATTGTSTTFTAANTAQTTTTAGYASQAATAGGYKDLGLVMNPPVNSACSAATNCQFSMLVNISPH